MPATKNALHRYRILDEMLSNRGVMYNISTLTDGLNQRLQAAGYEGVSQRTVEYDINFIEHEFADCVTLLRTPYSFHSEKSDKEHLMSWIHYEDSNTSIFIKPLAADEEHLLYQTLSLLGHFDGIPSLAGLEQLKARLKMAESAPTAVVMESCCLEHTNYFGQLFSAIINKVPVKLHHHTFDNPSHEIVYLVHPYQLREYNNRWYLMGCAEIEGVPCENIWPFRLDSVDAVVPVPQHTFVAAPEPVECYFDDIIGVTRYVDAPCHTICFWVSGASDGYVEHKPLHASQVHLSRPRQQRLHEQYPDLDGGTFYEIRCVENYELIRELSAFGSDLLVLEPAEIRDKVRQRAEEICCRYNQLFPLCK